MLKIKPIVTYSLAAVIIVWVMLGAITLPNATRWFKGSGNSIKEDLVSFNSSKPSMTIDNAIPVKYAQKDFRDNIILIDNTPDVAKEGLQGILYNRGEACALHLPNISTFNTQYNISKIALIEQSTNCYLVDKIMNAERDGAIAAIIFDNGSSSDQQTVMGVVPKSVRIPAFYVNQDIGISMINDLKNAAQAEHQQGAIPLMVRVNLLPKNKPALDYWQFVLIIVGAMLVTSIICITALQCHMWHKARERRQEENEALTMAEQEQLTADENYWRNIIGQPPRLMPQPRPKKQRLNQSLVNLLPTRMYKDDKEKITEEGDEKSSASANSLNTAYEPSHCVICLEPFEHGDILRRLPCDHEYHRDCVDVWLTRKCGSCPLCLHYIQIPTVPDEIHAQIQQQDHYYEIDGDLVEVWQSLTRDEQVLLRQRPFAFNPTPSSTTSFTNPYPPA